MRDHPAHNVPLLGASWGARLSQVMFISLACRVRLYPLPPRQVLEMVAYHCIEIILSRTSERNGDEAGSRCWRTLCAGRLPTSKGPTRNGRLLPAHQSQHHHVFSPGVVDQVYLVVGAAHGGDFLQSVKKENVLMGNCDDYRQVEHDSYTCHAFPGSKGFPTEVLEVYFPPNITR